MNRIFGFLREKLLQAKEENQSELQNILSAIEFEAYSEPRMLNLLQEIKTNYLEWNIMIANEASTGLYYTQVHHKTALLKKLKARKEGQHKQERLDLVLAQMRKTLGELNSIEKLNYRWANSISERVQALAEASVGRQQKQQSSERQQIDATQQETKVEAQPEEGSAEEEEQPEQSQQQPQPQPQQETETESTQPATEEKDDTS